MISESLPKKKLRNTTVRNMTWGVFKVYEFFLKNVFVSFQSPVVNLLQYRVLTRSLHNSHRVVNMSSKSSLKDAKLQAVSCQFLSPPVLMHGGLICIAFCLSVCPSVCDKITR